MTSISIRRLGCPLALVMLFASAPIARAQSAAGVTGGGNTSAANLPDSPSARSAQAPNQSAAYEPITGEGRVGWVVSDVVNPFRIIGDAAYAGVDTAINTPKEYGPHWDGFGKRVGIAVAGTAISNTLEASFGSVWGEDPRYFRAAEGSFGSRLGNVIRQTFVARGRSGAYRPAYARFIAIPGSAWIANTYLPDSISNNEDAAYRAAEGFASRMGSNAWDEFWPDIKAKVFHHGS